VPTQPLYATDYGRNESMEHRVSLYDTAHALRHGDGAFVTRAANDIAPSPFLEQSYAQPPGVRAHTMSRLTDNYPFNIMHSPPSLRRGAAAGPPPP